MLNQGPDVLELRLSKPIRDFLNLRRRRRDEKSIEDMLGIFEASKDGMAHLCSGHNNQTPG